MPTASGSTSKMATTWKPWSAKMSELAIACPRCPAPKRAMLCWPEVRRILRISVTSELDAVADAALAELAEAREVAADLGRVDVRVLGQLLRGDRLLAHLPGLDQHLQIARQPRGDAQREALAVDWTRLESPPRPPRGPFALLDAHARRVPDQPLGRYRARRRTRSASSTSSETIAAVHLDHRDPLQVAGEEARRPTRCRSRAARRAATSAAQSPGSARGPRRRGDSPGRRVENQPHARASQPR